MGGVQGEAFFRSNRLARQTRLVNLQVGRFKEIAVGRHLVARFYDDDIAYYYFAPRYLHDFSFANHLDGLLLAQLGEHVKLTGGITLKKETNGSSQDNGKDNA